MATTTNTTTRRGLLGLFAAAAPAMALSSISTAAPLTRNDRFVLAMATIHPNGRLAAEHALAAGMNPERLSTVLTSMGTTRTGEGVPALLFETEEGRYRCFRPRGEDS